MITSSQIDYIERNWRLTDRQLAKFMGISPTTVGKHRSALENSGRILPRRKLDTTTEASWHDQIRKVSISAIRPSPENDELYNPAKTDDPEFIALCRDIKANGILQRPIVTTDGYLISGHRRYAAAKVIGMDTIVVEVDPTTSREADRERFVQLLASHNRQRSKTNQEKVREQVAFMDGRAWQSVAEYREVLSAIEGVTSVVLPPPKTRSAITEKHSLREAIVGVVEALRPYWPISDRKVFYELLNIPGLMRNDVRQIPFLNNLKSYNDVTDMVTRMRLEGSIDFDAIGDETRPVMIWDTHQGITSFVESELEDLFSGYSRDLLQSQPNHIEILAEKNTVASMLRRTAAKYTLPMTSGRGYSSLPPRKAMADRFQESGKDRLVIICVTDFDPEGLDIPTSFGASLRDDFDIDEDSLVVTRAALNHEQIQSMELHAGQVAKDTSSRYKAFAEQFGGRCWELEAVPTASLIEIVEAHVRAVLDIDSFNDELEAQSDDRSMLDQYREAVRGAIRGIDL